MQTALFGKLPAHGDFINRGLPAPLRKSLDHWITRHIGQRSLPAGALRVRLTLGGAPYFAVIIASRDKHGRGFPIVAVASDQGQELPVVDHWCDLSAEMLSEAISDGTEADTLVQALPSLPNETKGEPQTADILWQQGCAPQPLASAIAALNSD
jgi:type VI secretion system protein ImpM